MTFQYESLNDGDVEDNTAFSWRLAKILKTTPVIKDKVQFQMRNVS